ncbi:hypothetical protein HMPREF0971_02150 [Segatella oris F0302]|uniref:Uncharacterized protein n=1 Tax=Segatella oris F0302 TaxID=649760 RepID=D1QT24_9BACT|nr:hypothetical protein HMPREF0971_02150 [Segatella oris F0302]
MFFRYLFTVNFGFPNEMVMFLNIGFLTIMISLMRVGQNTL